MKAFEFEAQLKPGNTLTVPPEVAQQLPPQEPFRVIVLIADDEEEREWIRFGNEQFLKGYAEGDAIYDQL
jgi:hypothetical protein